MRKNYVLKADGTAGSRGDAVVYGLIKYNTGKACRRGHFADRYTSTGACVQCLDEHNRAQMDDRRTAESRIVEGRLSKEEAEQLGHPFYLTGRVLECGHAGVQRVIDDACMLCVNEPLDIAAKLLS